MLNLAMKVTYCGSYNNRLLYCTFSVCVCLSFVVMAIECSAAGNVWSLMVDVTYLKACCTVEVLIGSLSSKYWDQDGVSDSEHSYSVME